MDYCCGYATDRSSDRAACLLAGTGRGALGRLSPALAAPDRPAGRTGHGLFRLRGLEVVGAHRLFRLVSATPSLHQALQRVPSDVRRCQRVGGCGRGEGRDDLHASGHRQDRSHHAGPDGDPGGRPVSDHFAHPPEAEEHHRLELGDHHPAADVSGFPAQSGRPRPHARCGLSQRGDPRLLSLARRQVGGHSGRFLGGGHGSAHAVRPCAEVEGPGRGRQYPYLCHRLSDALWLDRALLSSDPEGDRHHGFVDRAFAVVLFPHRFGRGDPALLRSAQHPVGPWFRGALRLQFGSAHTGRAGADHGPSAQPLGAIDGALSRGVLSAGRPARGHPQLVSEPDGTGDGVDCRRRLCESDPGRGQHPSDPQSGLCL